MKSTLIKCKHGEFLVNPHDTVIGQSLIKYGEFAEHELILLSHFLREGYWVIDVGANIGTHAVFFARTVGVTGKVIAIEPQTEIYNILNKNLCLNNLQNVEALNAVSGAESGRILLPPIDYNQEGNFGALSFKVDNIDRYLPVKESQELKELSIIPLDQLKLKRCDLLKVDSECMEKDVLEGAHKTINQFRPILYLENNNRIYSQELLKHLKQIKYKVHWHLISYFREKNFANYQKNIFDGALELNILCIPEEKAVDARKLPEVENKDQWLPDEIANKTFDLSELLKTAESFN